MNEESIRISVITPTYNDARFIKDTINSVLAQTHKNFELLIVDDCSTDNTIDIIESFDDPRIKLFKNNKNSGAAFSRNRALQESTGDYIAFLDGDDLWHPNKLASQLKYMIERNYFFSCTEYVVIDETGCETGVYLTGPTRITHRKLLRACYIGCLTVMFKKSLYPNLQIPNDILKRNDYALWLKISEKAPCFMLKERLSYYRKRKSGSISSGKKSSLIKYHKALFRKLYGYSPFKSSIYAYRNIVFYLLKRLLYVKRA